MYSFATIAAKTVGHFAVPSRSHETETERHFCPGMSCLTDEVLVKPISPANGVWVLTDQTDGSSWLTRGHMPTCPSCGAKLIPAQ